MTRELKKVLSLLLIVLGVVGIIFTVVNAQVTFDNMPAVLAGEVIKPLIPKAVMWGIDIIQIVLIIYLVFAAKLKKTNLFWLILLYVGSIVIGIRQLLRLNKEETV
ncbi:hypothetical protein Hs30E_01220 [Lactococcus hodotermopsidis]|uniref:Uncharacterized protein n=1 Tax=Pseudolactococcus hodotermopsidis TaxID=2709157 RepID=A0A6A0BAT7_9LACT|nr:hypothetical protein [Lactococcus hodotermopsidis]GFH41571.1 hypothetical protein Hs30E_01220 [Lactococcus hodotermopsidis]